jgi:small-conductance mechanosensitive channel
VKNFSITDLLEQIRSALGIHLFDLAGTSFTVGTLFAILGILLVTLGAASLARRITERFLKSRNVSDEGTVGIASRLVYYLTLALGFSIALSTSGVNLSALFAAGAVFAVALGFAMQNIVQNFVSGILLLGERTIKPGDVLEVEGQYVKVRDMGVRVTVARTLDDEDIIIPNSVLASSSVKNFTFRERTYRIRVQVGVSYDSDLRLVRKVLETAAAEVKWRVSEKRPRVQLLAFGSSSVDYDISVWIDDPWQAAARRSSLREAIWWALKDNGIVIAYPQVDVHFDARAISAVARRSSEDTPD